MSSPISEPAPASGAPGGKTSFMNLDSNLGAMLCYILEFVCCLGLVLSIVFLITEKENRFVKFHAVQSLFLLALAVVANIIIQILHIVLTMVLDLANLGGFAGLFTWLLGCLVLFIFAVLNIIGGLKAYSGQWYKLPIIGEFAWKVVNK
jgi:Predicted membrane protein